MKESYIKQLIRILQESEVDSLEISSFWGMSNIKLSKNSKEQKASPSSYSQPSTPNIVKVEEKKNSLEEKKISPKEDIEETRTSDEVTKSTSDKKNLNFITAPLVGTYYSSPKPEDPPFIKKGDRIEIGQTIFIIEAMKIFNEIDSEISGTVEETLINDGAPVEYGQKIISIIPDD